MTALYRLINDFNPEGEAEIADKALMCELLDTFGDHLLHRSCHVAHFTSSAFILTPDLSRCLMVYHNLYQAWTWSGGHADGDANLMAVAIREAEEETGITGMTPISTQPLTLDILPVFAHYKRGCFVNAHLHLSVGYAFIGDPSIPLRIQADENSAVRWIDTHTIPDTCNEAHMQPIYRKLLHRVQSLV